MSTPDSIVHPSDRQERAGTTLASRQTVAPMEHHAKSHQQRTRSLRGTGLKPIGLDGKYQGHGGREWS